MLIVNPHSDKSVFEYTGTDYCCVIGVRLGWITFVTVAAIL